MDDPKKTPVWSDIQPVVDYLIDKHIFDQLSDNKLFDEMVCVTKYIENHVSEWNEVGLDTDKRWAQMFQHVKENSINDEQISKLAEYVLALPGSNAAVERVFSAMNKIWTAEKTQLSVPVLKSILITKLNFEMNCMDFYSMLLSKPRLLKQISSNDKYED